jgi:hypothetical protein
MFQESLTLEFVGGSRDGELTEAADAPAYIEIDAVSGWREIYERQTDEPPFRYVQIGYVPQEQWN